MELQGCQGEGHDASVLYCAPPEPIGTDRIPSRHPISARNPSGSERFRSDSERKLGVWHCLLRIQLEELILKKKIIICNLLLPNTLNKVIRNKWTAKTRPSGHVFVSRVRHRVGQTRRTRPFGCVLHVWIKGMLGEYPRCEVFASGQYRVPGTV